MCETKNLEPFQINGNYPFSQQYLQTQVNKIPITNTINIEHYDLRFDFVIQSCNGSNQISQNHYRS
jgi:hypothetical protein